MVAIPPKEFVSRSQAGQDMFTHALCGDSGTFLDIGANHPVIKSNSYALDRIGWSGLCVDSSGDAMLAHEASDRRSQFYLTDATMEQNWLAALAQAGLPTDVISYLSLDIDQWTLPALRGLPLDQIRFRVLTIEHDAYRLGPEPRAEMLAILHKYGYDVLCADVADHGLPFEIWAVDPTRVDPALANKFRRNQPTEWREFFK